MNEHPQELVTIGREKRHDTRSGNTSKNPSKAIKNIRVKILLLIII